MKEKQIDVDIKFKYDFAGLKNQIKKSNLCKIVADYENDDTYSLMFACEDEHMSKLNNIVAHSLSDFYINRYKKYYLEHHINLNAIERMFVPAYICAIASFDTFTDKDISLDADYTINKISVIPFLYFKLQGLIHRWQMIANLTNDNIQCFDKSTAVIDLLCYLVKNQQNKSKILKVCFEEKGIKIYNNNELSFQSFSQNKSDIGDLIAVLVKLCPQKLIINSTNANSNIEMIRKIFSEKVL